VAPSPSGHDDAALLELARRTAREAGELVLRHRRDGVSVARTKSSLTDVVTEADQASEQLIRSRLLDARPDDGFLGEEGDDLAGSSGVRWVVDPIDGTVNYLYGLPDFAVSIAALRGDEVVAGVVLAPATGTEHVATRGGGALRDGVPLQVRHAAGLDQALVATGFGYEADVRARQGSSVARLLPRVRDIRRGGSCALDLCGLAAGHLDAYVEEGTHLWDRAAAGLIATEAGARVEVWTTSHGTDLVVASAAAAFEEFAALVRSCEFAGQEPVTGSAQAP
jgi:myo-inositol-1(or 4)-monophosphatase